MPPTIIGSIRRTSQFDIAITIRVGSGSVAPRPANIAAKVGIPFHKMTVMTIAAIEMTAIGYIMAPLIWAFSLTDFSM